jgi:hypothetical protein
LIGSRSDGWAGSAKEALWVSFPSYDFVCRLFCIHLLSAEHLLRHPRNDLRTGFATAVYVYHNSYFSSRVV